MSELPFEWTGSPELTGLAYDFMETEGADLLAGRAIKPSGMLAWQLAWIRIAEQ